jgi:hypothetical protein
MLNFYFKANVVESVAGLRRGRQLPSVEEGGLMYIPLGGSGNIRYRHFLCTYSILILPKFGGENQN